MIHVDFVKEIVVVVRVVVEVVLPSFLCLAGVVCCQMVFVMGNFSASLLDS